MIFWQAVRQDDSQGGRMRQSVVLLWISLLWLACSGSAAVAGEAEWKAHMQAGQAAYGQGDYRSATVRFEAALKEAELAFGREQPGRGPSSQQPGVAVRGAGPHHRRRAAVPPRAGDRGESARPRAPARVAISLANLAVL